MGLAGCAPAAQVAARRPLTTSGGSPTAWRVAVWGDAAGRDDEARAAIEQMLVQRGIAARIVQGPGPVDHVLEVRLGSLRRTKRRVAAAGGGTGVAIRCFYEARETVREGRDARLSIQRSFRTGAPADAVSAAVAADPLANLAAQIGDALLARTPS